MRLKASLLLVLCLLTSSVHADVYLRQNNLGYAPKQPKVLVLMADSQQKGKVWRLKDSDKQVRISGKLMASVASLSDHTAKPFNYLIDLTKESSPGDYRLLLGEQDIGGVNILANPYRVLANDILRHLKVERSGTDDTLLRPASHLGDAKLMVYRPKGPLENGQWQVDPEGKTVDMLGGWYDAGDYMKFTLTIAYTSYYLLRAYEENVDFFAENSKGLPRVLEEALVGLEYLYKTHPEKDEFIIQVSTSKDHLEGYRLPNKDKRDGKREALSAISPAHMGLTSAALALGAKVIETFDSKKSKNFQKKAEEIYLRALEKDAMTEAVYEKKNINDIYRDNDATDNIALAAAELYIATGKKKYLKHAKIYSTKAGEGHWASWCCVTSSANYRLAPYDKNARRRFQTELAHYAGYDKDKGNIWGVPMRPSWAPLIGQFVVAAYGGLSANVLDKDYSDLLWDNVDYFFGRNNWGVAFIASKQVPRSVKNVYNQIYKLTNTFPTGAVAEGPGDRATYESLKQWIKESPGDRVMDEFNTSAQIFYDNSGNFQTMETTIKLQATALYMLAVADKLQR